MSPQVFFVKQPFFGAFSTVNLGLHSGRALFARSQQAGHFPQFRKKKVRVLFFCKK